MKTELPTILDPYTNEIRALGSLPSDPKLVSSIPQYSGELLPKSEIRDFDHFPTNIIKIKDQNGKGACNGFATALAMILSRYAQGMPYIDLSGWYIYSILCNGIDRGSNILQAYDLIQENGCAPEDLVPYGLINPRQLSSEAKAAAPRFKLELGERLTDFDQMLSHVALGGMLNYSVHVGNTFNDLDSDGVPGISKGVGNHAVAGGLGIKKSTKWGHMINGYNSWSEKWGKAGRFMICEALIEAGTYFECFTVHAVSDDPLGPNPPTPRGS